MTNSTKRGEPKPATLGDVLYADARAAVPEQAAHTRLTTGTQRKWRDVSAGEKSVWLRLARTAIRLLQVEEASPR
jgi:hypothetical protein